MDYRFEGGDEDIVTQVRYEEAVRCGDVVEIESDEEGLDSGHGDTEMDLGEVIQLCEKMERICITYGTPDTAVDPSQCLQKFRITIREMEGAWLKQAMLDKWFGSGRTHCD
ncbi:hypothetical protein PISMIDRAFT_14830 [Pisolithus microcarpus 441]|uniref:Uncharacterized protein n=1 Tax=Pisolithus microcarpus 441 TaxID=765257 RepID=A0A0C9ZCX0_9AGAM|nr:hypothetical protein PISMIDRAFT_14830 [Pisolithus microcarpus 441]